MTFRKTAAYRAAISILAVLALFAFAACSDSSDDSDSVSTSATYVYDSRADSTGSSRSTYTMTFYSDGTWLCTYDGENYLGGTYVGTPSNDNARLYLYLDTIYAAYSGLSYTTDQYVDTIYITATISDTTLSISGSWSVYFTSTTSTSISIGATTFIKVS